jgi:hypothetical protein
MARISVGYPRPKETPFKATQYAPGFSSTDSVVLTRNASDQVTKATYSSGRVVDIVYNAGGNVEYTEDGKYRRTPTYDASGVITEVVVTEL